MVGLAALDALAIGVIVVDADLRVRLSNAAAEAMAQGGLGLGFRLRREAGRVPAATQLVVGEAAAAAALLRLVRSTAMAGEAGGALRLKVDAETSDRAAGCAMLVAPLPARLPQAPLQLSGRVPGQALILLRELADPVAPRAALLRDLFGLTPAEAEVARALATGASKGAVAGARGLRETTVRTQVRGVLAKTGAVNLRDLARILAGLGGM